MYKFEELDKRKTSEVESSLTEKFLNTNLLEKTIENILFRIWSIEYTI